MSQISNTSKKQVAKKTVAAAEPAVEVLKSRFWLLFQLATLTT